MITLRKEMGTPYRSDASSLQSVPPHIVSGQVVRAFGEVVINAPARKRAQDNVASLVRGVRNTAAIFPNQCWAACGVPLQAAMAVPVLLVIPIVDILPRFLRVRSVERLVQ